MSPRRLTRVLLWCGVVGPPLFIVVFLVDGATRAGYDPTYHPVSALSLGPRGWVQITNFVLTGVLLLGFAVGLRRVLRPGRADLWGPLAVGALGLGLLLSGVFVMDPAHGYPPSGPLDGVATSVPGVLHDNLGIVVFLSVPVACFVLARRSARRPTGRAWVWYDLLTGLAGLALLGTFGTAWETDHPSTGLIQRAMIAVDWAWIIVLALRLLAETRSRAGEPAAIGHRPPATGHRLPATGHRLPATGYRLPATREFLAPAVRQAAPVTAGTGHRVFFLSPARPRRR